MCFSSIFLLFLLDHFSYCLKAQEPFGGGCKYFWAVCFFTSLVVSSPSLMFCAQPCS